MNMSFKPQDISVLLWCIKFLNEFIDLKIIFVEGTINVTHSRCITMQHCNYPLIVSSNRYNNRAAWVLFG